MKQKIKIKGSLEELMQLVNIEIALYKQQKKKPEALNNLKTSLTEKIAEFVTKGVTPMAITIDENSRNFVDRHVEALVKNIDKQDARNFVQKWAANIIDYVRGRKKSLDTQNIEAESLAITKRLEDLVASDPENLKTAWNNQTIKIGKLNIRDMSKYDLLDNLTDFKKIESLNDDDLKHLYQISMTEVLLNCQQNNQYSIASILKKIETANKMNKPISRQEMLADMQNILKEKDPKALPSIAEINMIKSDKAVRNFTLIKDAKIYNRGPIDEKLAEELVIIKDKIKELQDHYIFKEIIHDLISALDPKEDKIFLLDIYKKIGAKEPLKELENELLSQCKKNKGLTEQLTNADKIDNFKLKLLEQLKMNKTSGQIAGAMDKAKIKLESKVTKAPKFQAKILLERTERYGLIKL